MQHRMVISNLCVDRGYRRIIDDLSVTVSSGQVLVLMGVNGAGKTTLLRTIAGFLPSRTGDISFEGLGPEEEALEHCHLLAVQDAVKTSLTVMENVAFWHAFHARPGCTPEAALARMGLTPLSDIPAGLLSTGQRRRLGITRLLVAQKPIWLLDEPTVGLDEAGIATLRGVVIKHLDAGGSAVIATHTTLDLPNEIPLHLQPATQRSMDFET